MIDLKRNGKKEPVKATGVRVRESSSLIVNGHSFGPNTEEVSEYLY